jgi:membrane associated rhomboid family serine protease
MFLLALLTILGVGIYVMRPDERRRALRVLTGHGSALGRAITREVAACAPWLETLRARGGQPVLALAIATGCVVVFAASLSGTSAGGDALVRWGATFGPRTTNGEWWRLVTAVFLHRGLFSLAIDVVAIVQLGLVVERIFGRLAFGTVFVASGVLANTIHLAAHPVVVRTGASGALYGLYGLLIVWVVRGILAPSALTIPLPAYRLLAPVAGLFLLTSMVSDAGALTANVAALGIGLVAGSVLVGAIEDESASPIRLAAIAGSAVMTVFLMAMPSAGTTDVRPEIARVLDLETRTAEPYGKLVGQFTRGATSSRALAAFIDTRILPEVRDAQARLDHLHGVPAEHRVVVADAQRYVRMRLESWDLRSRALHSSNMRALRLADDKERESLDALEQLQAVDIR